MPNLPFENLGSVGLITDLQPYETPPEAWSRVENIRFNREGAQKFKGHKEVFTGGLHAPYWLFSWKSSTGYSWLYVGLNRVGRIVSTAHSDVTRYTTVLGDDNYTATSSSIFSGTLLGDLPLWTYDGEVDPPQSWNAANSRFEDLPNWQASTFTDILTVVDRYVVALRVKKSGVAFNPRMVKWSQAADPGTYPSSWDETDPATGAGEVTLAETQGEIITAALLNNSMLIYKEDSVISMRFVGGQSIFRFDTLFSQFGAISRNAVAILEDSHVVVTQGDVILHNGTTQKSIIDDKNRQLFFDNLDEALVDKLVVTQRSKDGEIWINYADTDNNGALNKALIWNYQDNTWSQRDLQDFRYITPGTADTAAVPVTYDSQTTLLYDSVEADIPYQFQSDAPVFTDLLAIDNAATKFYKLNSSEQFDGVNMTCRLERSGIPFVGRDRDGTWKTDLDTRKFIRRVHPRLKASEALDFYVGGQEVPDGPISWQGPHCFDPNTQRYFDCRVNTRFFAIRIESDSNMSWTLYGYTLDLDILGEAPR